MDFLSIRITEQSVNAVAEHMRSGCPVRQPSPKKAPSFRMPIVASFPISETTVSIIFPSFMQKTVQQPQTITLTTPGYQSAAVERAKAICLVCPEFRRLDSIKTPTLFAGMG